MSAVEARHAPTVLSPEQVAAYHRDGYLLVERLIGPELLGRLHQTVAKFLERSRAVDRSDDVFDLAPGHSAESPRLRRLKTPDEQDPLFWEVASGILADVAADLIGAEEGGGVTFHHSKLNFKWSEANAKANAVRWHQDIQFYPHTNYSPMTIGLYLNDVGSTDGPLTVLPGSHEGPLYDQYDADGNWTGCLSDADAATLDESKAVSLCGPAGSITVHNCRTVHSSPPATTAHGRPLLLNAYASADAFPYTVNPSVSRHDRQLLRGRPARWARHDPRPCLVPPDWSGGYSSIFAAQSGEEKKAGEEKRGVGGMM